MLEIRNLTKIYRSKTGEEVRALNDVSISFPECGMVFILGKSGSGKSTLLNIMGGLDSYDNGEFVIKGKSSKDFAGSDFDAYRNTFIGFIFQEYNVLDDFTVGANIGLALELQGKKATNEKISEILSQVDLLSFAKRKPNELSGGQKQRVAIARALVKEPQIIMADEPTGALDSNTGKQIFDTLKELSKEKLVLIVSHDRDFAERYADRIVELADGKIISDVTKHEKESIQLSEGIQQITGNILRIKGGYRLTERDLQMINNYLAANESGDVLLSGDGRVNTELRSAAGIGDDGNATVFEGTEAEDVSLKAYQKEDSKFIRSKLPMKNALKMGTSGLKHKKFRLVMTIFLSLLAFALFGFADSLGAYEKIAAAVSSIQDSHIKTAAVSVSVRHENQYENEDPYVFYNEALMNDQDIQLLKEKTGIDFVPVFSGTNVWNGGFSMASHFQSYEDNEVYTGKLAGIVNITPDIAARAGLTVTGRLPEAEGEIAITELAYRQFNEYGFQNEKMDESVKAGALNMNENDPDSILGKHITLSGSGRGDDNNTYRIVGVVDTRFDYDRYESLLPSDRSTGEDSGLARMVLLGEVAGELSYGFHMLAFVTENDLNAITAEAFSYNIAEYMSGTGNKGIVFSFSRGEGENRTGYTTSSIASSAALSLVNVNWLDGTARTALGVNEIVIPEYWLNDMKASSAEYTLTPEVMDAKGLELYGAHWTATDPAINYADRVVQAYREEYITNRLQDPTVLRELSKYKYERETGNEYTDANLLPVEEAAQYWNQAFDSDISLSWDSPTPKSAYTLEQEAYAEILPFLLQFLGVTLPEGALENEAVLQSLIGGNYYAPTTILQEFSAQQTTVTVGFDEIRMLLTNAYAYPDAERLITNQTFINEVILSEENYANQWNDAKDDSSKLWIAQIAYSSYLGRSETGGYTKNPFGNYTGKSIETQAQDVINKQSGVTVESLLEAIKLALYEESYETQTGRNIKDYDFTIVGTFTNEKGQSDFIISDTVLADYKVWYEAAQMEEWDHKEIVAEHESGKWMFALAPMPTDEDTIRTLVEMSYDEESDLQFSLQNAVMNTLSNFNDFIEIGAQVFLYVGIGFAVFSALLLMNFISTSISYKKREIGVLRAVGARSSDVFKIFFSEALIIALINFILAVAAAIAAVLFTNGLMRSYGINVTLLSFGPRQVILMLLISVVVALLASFLPVWSIARRKPIDAIKDR
ncbi:MAG: ABC transporter ATP-binding protein/permease [Clostridia bacterium]|nr:ABC transporter ATP-binding protein/permease [Clostridia bacterium]